MPMRKSSSRIVPRPLAHRSRALGPLVCLLAFAGCSEENAPEPLSIFPGPGPAAALFELAKQKGLFENEGLKVTLRRFETGPQSLAALRKGALDIAHPSDFAFARQSFSQRDLRIIASVIRWNGMEMVSRKDRGIRTPRDLKGKTIGLTLGTQSEFALAGFLVSHNLSFDSATLIHLPSRKDTVSALVNGNVDAVVTVNQYVYRLERRLGENATTWPLQENFLAFPLLVTTRQHIAARAEVFDRFLKAMKIAVVHARDNPAEMKKIAHETLGYDREFLDFFWTKIRFEMSLPQSLLLVLENEARWLMRKGLVTAPKVPNYLDFIHFDAMDAVSPEAVTIIR